MRHYDLPLPPDVKAALAAIHAGVVCVGVTGRATGLEGFFGCELELASGQVISICADQNDLEFKFEVFPIKAVFASAFEAEERQQTLICAPVEVVLLKTQDWLDPGIPCEGAIGQNPIMQCQGLPGEAPATAITACTYIGGIELRGSNGATLVVATLAFPYAIHVSDFAGGGAIERQAYASVPLVMG